MELGYIKARDVVVGQNFFYGVYILTRDVTTTKDGKTTIRGWNTGNNKSVQLKLDAEEPLMSIGFPDAKEWMVTSVKRKKFTRTKFILSHVGSSFVEKSRPLYFHFEEKIQYYDQSLLNSEILQLFWECLKSKQTLFISLCTFDYKERIVSWRVVSSGAEVAAAELAATVEAEVASAGAKVALSGAEVPTTAENEVPIH